MSVTPGLRHGTSLIAVFSLAVEESLEAVAAVNGNEGLGVGTSLYSWLPKPVMDGDPVNGFWAAFFNSVTMIIVTELGDKTFFIAAVLAMRYDRWLIFTGAIGE
jgi:Ca2+/H+ antiporter, TMEM165/GDT1 family